MPSQRLQIDLNYLGNNNILIYPLYSENGEKILDARAVLSPERVNGIIEKYGNIVYYSFSEEMSNIPNHRISAAFYQSREIEEEILKTDKLSKNSYNKAENLIENVLDDLHTSDTDTIKLLKDLNSFDDYTYNHSVNVLLLTAVFATKMGKFTTQELKGLLLGAYLHDIGKLKIDKQLLNKKGKLTVSEYQKMKRHPQLGYELIRNVAENDKIVQQVVLFHHEKYNNKGYYNLPYENLPLYPKLVSICDVFDALTTNRPYRLAVSPAHAFKVILNSLNVQFDFQIISDFVNKLGSILNNSQFFYSKFDICELNSQELAIIMDYGKEDILKPDVIVFCKFEKSKNNLNVRFYDKPKLIKIRESENLLMSRILTNKRQIDSLKDKLLERSLLQISV